MEKSSTFKPIHLAMIAIYFISGACSLMYEVIWRRLLKLILGNTTYATAITVAVFMGGLALGAFLMRKRADSFKNKLLVYGIIEGTITVFALLTIGLLRGMDGLYQGLFGLLSGAPGLLLIIQILISALILLIPSSLMGATLPLLSSWLVKGREMTGFKTGILYSFNTFGALFGASLAGFFLIRLIGVYPTYYIALGGNALIAAAAVVVSLRIIPLEIHEHHKHRKEKAVRTTWQQYVTDGWLFLSGFIALGYEMIWMRTIVHFLRAEIYVFSAVLVIYLFGYAGGVQIGSWLVRKVKAYEKTFGIILQLTGIAGILFIPILIQIGIVGGRIFQGLPQWLLQFDGYVIHLFYSALLFLIPSLIMGMGFPFLIQMRKKYFAKTGETVATAYSINTLGSVAGTLITGLVLIPMIGAQLSVQLLGLAGILGGIAVIAFTKTARDNIFPVAAMIFGIAMIIIFPTQAYLQWINVCENRGLRQSRLVDVLEGINTTASVHIYTDDGSKVISTAGINVAGDSPELRQTQKVQGHVPIILHGNPQKVLTVGFGSGELTKTLTAHSIPSINCVEIAPEMVKMAKKHFSHINLGYDLEKHVNMIYMDAKNYIHLTDTTYDVIMNDSIWPGAFAESSSLYTKEYFEDGKRLLTEDGVYSTWLPINMTTLSLKSIIKTFNDVFENTIFVYPHNVASKHLLLVGQKVGHRYNYPAMQQQFDKPEVRISMEYLNIENVDEIIDFILTGSASLDNLASEFPFNSDYYPVVEFDVGRGRRNLDPDNVWRQLLMIVEDTRRIRYKELIDFSDLPRQQQKATIEHLYRSQQANEYLFRSFLTGPYEQRLEMTREGLSIDPDNKDLIKQATILKESIEKRNSRMR